MSKKLTEQEIKDRIYFIHDDKISLSNILEGNKSEFVCNICEYKWITTRSSIFSGCGCKKCGSRSMKEKQKLSIEKVYRFILDNNCVLLDDKYLNYTTPILIRFECNHEYSISFSHFKRGRRCPECGNRRSHESSKLSMEEINNRLLENNLTLIEFPNGYETVKSIINYSCEFGHFNSKTVMDFSRYLSCKICTIERRRKEVQGMGHHNWKGTQSLKSMGTQNIDEWKLDSAKSCDYKCVITGDRFDNIHHLYSFNKIVDETLEELNLIKKVKMGEYIQEEILLFIEKLRENHRKYPLGVCLRKDVHKLFHKYYGKTNNYPSQFEEFKSRIQSGEIIISQ